MGFEEHRQQMTTKEMQGFIDKAMFEGLNYQDALVELARYMGLHPAAFATNSNLTEMWMEMRFS